MKSPAHPGFKAVSIASSLLASFPVSTALARDQRIDSTASLNVSISEVHTEQTALDSNDRTRSASAALTSFTRFTDTGYGRRKGDRILTTDLTATASNTIVQTEGENGEAFFDSVQNYAASTGLALADTYPRSSMTYSLSAGLSTSPVPPEFEFTAAPRIGSLELLEPVQTYSAGMSSGYSLTATSNLSSGASVSLSGTDSFFTTLNLNLGVSQALSARTSLQANLGSTFVQSVESVGQVNTAGFGITHAFSERFSGDSQLILTALPAADQASLDYRAGGSLGISYRARSDTFRLAASRGATPRRTGGSLYFSDSLTGSWNHVLSQFQYLAADVSYRHEITPAGPADSTDTTSDALIEALSGRVNYGIGIITSHQGKLGPIGSVGQLILTFGVEAAVVTSSVQNQNRVTGNTSLVLPL